jgi:PKD repeat protein
VASFTFTSSDLTATFSSAGSSDSDGTIVSRSWDFGDGDTSTAANPSHTYAAEGTYPVTLTVTDDDGDSDSISQDVFVAPIPNTAPTAAFSWSAASLEVSFNSAASADSDGSIVSRTWDFGDGNTDVGVSPNHTYAAAGTYDVTLTVTDDDGATGSVAHQFTLTDAPVEIASDAFARTVANGWGSAPKGGSWTLNGNASLFNVNGGSGAIAMNSPGAGPGATLGSVSATTTDATVKVGVDKLANSGGVYASLASRTSGSNSYRAKVKIDTTGRVTVYLIRAPGEVTLASMVLPASTTYAVGEQLNIRLQTQGTSPTTLRAKVWEVGTAEPAAWQRTTTDNTAGFQGPGGFSLVTYLATGASNTPVIARFDDFVVTTIP